MAVGRRTRTIVIERAQFRCEYCMYSDEFGLVSFQVDHIIAVKHGGSDEIDNLALSCIHCNQHKGSDLSSYDFRSEEIIPLFNPRKHRWSDHFYYDNERIIPSHKSVT